jgi:hypothetical protein
MNYSSFGANIPGLLWSRVLLTRGPTTPIPGTRMEKPTIASWITWASGMFRVACKCRMFSIDLHNAQSVLAENFSDIAF